jgi:glycosyltransferase involved in cell wall biosynthesis
MAPSDQCQPTSAMKEDELTASTPAVQTIDAPRRRDLTVAFFSDSLPERNGTGAYYHDLCALLAQEVSHLKMFQPRGAVRYPRLAIPMPGDPTQKLISPNVIRITREFHQLRPDIVVVVTPGPFGMLGQFLSRQLGVPCLTAFHTDFEQLARIYWDPLSRKIVNGYLRRVNRALCRGSKAVLVNNEGLRDQVCELGAEKVEVMGTPLPRIFLDRPLSPLPEAIEQIAFAGRFAAEKNVDQIIKAAAHFPAIRFCLAGDGPMRKELEKSARGMENVKLLGWQSRNQLVDLIDKSNFLILPSKVETFGSIAFEALARGRPALVSANAGIQSWDGLREALFCLGEDEPLVDAIQRLLDLPPDQWTRRSRMSRKAAEEFHHRTILQWAEMLERYLS